MYFFFSKINLRKEKKYEHQCLKKNIKKKIYNL